VWGDRFLRPSSISRVYSEQRVCYTKGGLQMVAGQCTQVPYSPLCLADNERRLLPTQIFSANSCRNVSLLVSRSSFRRPEKKVKQKNSEVLELFLRKKRRIFVTSPRNRICSELRVGVNNCRRNFFPPPRSHPQTKSTLNFFHNSPTNGTWI
jgi:hypothetical protein